MLEGYRRKGHNKAEALWLDYLVWRCRNVKKDDSIWPYAKIRAVAASLVKHRKATREGNEHLDDYHVVPWELCGITTLYGRIAYPGPGRVIFEGYESNPPPTAPTAEQTLLSAACYFGCLSLVKDLLPEGVVTQVSFATASCNTLFLPHEYLAALSGQAEKVSAYTEKSS